MKMLLSLFALLASFISGVSGISAVSAFAADPPPKVLLVVAHPDDEYCFAATVFRIARELNGTVDQLVITNGEAGFHYSGPSEFIYGKHLSDEAVGRRELPAIRKHELENSGKILGIHKHIYLDEKDFGLTHDAAETLAKWDRKRISKFLRSTLDATHYDAVFTLLPTPTTHGHHQAAAILALDAVAQLPDSLRPVVLGCSDSSASAEPDSPEAREAEAARNFTSLEHFDQTRLLADQPRLFFDRRTGFGPEEKLNYHIYVNWMIAEHKSQGMFQRYYSKEDFEEFRIFSGGPIDAVARAKALMDRVSSVVRTPTAR